MLFIHNERSAKTGFDFSLTTEVRDYAMNSLNADLIGFAPASRYADAPRRMRPQGLMPDARTVVVMAIHHPDAAIELGGLQHPQIIGPYTIQYDMNSRLDEMSYRMGIFLEQRGWQALPIVSSNIWRYKGYKEMTEQFAPDLSHMHAAVAAGLAEFGYNGLAITPEYGARQRYVTIVTDAPLEPSPLLEPGSVCDNCMLCRKHCLSGALSKELDGWNKVQIEDKTYRYIRKNLWRCAWGEHFDLDLDLPIPDHVDEKVILAAVKEHGCRGGEMGSCLRYCVPKERRYFEPEYTDAPRRRRDARPLAGGKVHRRLRNQLLAMPLRHGADFAVVWSADDLAAVGIEAERFLPGTKSAVTYAVTAPASVVRGKLKDAAYYMVRQTAYDAVRELERAGYTAVSQSGIDQTLLHQALTGLPDGRCLITETLLTEARLDATPRQVVLPSDSKPAADADFEAQLRNLLQREGAVAIGVAPVARIDQIVAQMRPYFDGQKLFSYKDRAGAFQQREPRVEETGRRLKAPADYLAEARSVVVFALPMARTSVENTTRHEAEAVGPLAFAQYESANMLGRMLRRAIALCERHGIRAEWSLDLVGSASTLANPRGEQHDLFSNRFAAWAAGLARLGKGGFPINPAYGTRLRYAALIIDRELPPDKPLGDWRTELCDTCERCLEHCPVAAFLGEVRLEQEGIADSFRLIDQARCDWAKRFSLIAAEGTAYTGWSLNVPAPATITPENLADALRQHPPIEKARPCNFDGCILACPYTRSQA